MKLRPSSLVANLEKRAIELSIALVLVGLATLILFELRTLSDVLAAMEAGHLGQRIPANAEAALAGLEQALTAHRAALGHDSLIRIAGLAGLAALTLALAYRMRRRQGIESALRQSDARFRALMSVQQYAVLEVGCDGRIGYANPAAEQLLGYPHDDLVQMRITDLLAQGDRERVLADLRRFAVEQPEPKTYFNKKRTRDGRIIDVRIEWSYRRDDIGRVIGFVSVGTDISDYRRSQLLLDGRNRVLEMLARGAPLGAMLMAIVDYIEQISPHSLCSIHLLDPSNRTLTTAATLRLPEDYTRAVEGVRAGPGIGSCGHAAATGERVIVADVLSHPYWADFRDLMQRTDLRACWSQPILAADGQVLGTFAIYATRVMEPCEADLAMIESAASLAAIVIEHERAVRATREAEARARLLLDSSTEGIFGLDEDGRTSFVNPAAARMLGFEVEELIGQDIHALIHPATSSRPLRSPESCSFLRASREGRPLHIEDEVFFRRDGSHFPVEYWATPIVRNDRIDGTVITFHDISERKRSEAEIQHLAFHDALTGLPNRLLFKEEMGRAAAGLAREGHRFALHLLDLDGFKDVNDTLGHPIGDELLCAVAKRIGSIVRASDLFGRFGGDEFALLQVPVTDVADAALLAGKIVHAMNEPFVLPENQIHITTSIGIAIADQGSSDVDTLIARADVALYKAKEAGRSTHAFFEDTMTEQLRRELEIARELVKAIAEDQLLVEYQPQLDLHDGLMVGLEALVRWRHPERGLLYPGAFLPVAQKRRLIRGVSDWVLETACQQGREWSDRGLCFGRIAVNLCADQLRDEGFAARVLDVLQRTGLDPWRLELELTETVLIQADERTQRDITLLSERGIEFAIDDFGTGFSSLQYLRKFRADKIKIDREFVSDVTACQSDAEIVKATIALGAALGLITIAEGVETPEQAELLRRNGCRQVQGFLYSRALTAAEIEQRWLKASQTRAPAA
jgi:diguanylate cyclase (GGDEF)-like protein/PAS domain S-box-containing protein